MDDLRLPAVGQPDVTGLVCVKCGGKRRKLLGINLCVGRREAPSILVAYALCDRCDGEKCGEMAARALREAAAR